MVAPNLIVYEILLGTIAVFICSPFIAHSAIAAPFLNASVCNNTGTNVWKSTAGFCDSNDKASVGPLASAMSDKGTDKYVVAIGDGIARRAPSASTTGIFLIAAAVIGTKVFPAPVSNGST